MMLLTDEEQMEKQVEMLKNSDDELDKEYAEALIELIQAKGVINQLRIACDKALSLRGLVSAILDPLALDGEIESLRERYVRIEQEIREALNAERKFRRRKDG